MRLFFGLSLPDDVRLCAQACAQEAQKTIPGRYALAQNYHVTLAFLGEVPQERLEEAGAVLARCAAAFPAPKLSLDGFSHFGRRENGILVLRVKSEPLLDALHEELIGALLDAGLPATPGPFCAHITLARHADMSAGYPVCPQASFSCAQAHVYLSARDEKDVLRYTPLYTVSFQK